jgi:hypothetical protein
MYSGMTNPAFVNEEKYMAARFLFASTLEMINTQEAGFTMPLGLYDAAGVSWVMRGTSTYKATGADGTETGKSIADQDHFIALTYARNVWKGLTVGGNANIIAQNVVDVDAMDNPSNKMRFGFGVDAGLTYKVLRHRLFGNHILGVSTNNIVNMITDTDEKYAAALRFSLLSDFWKRRIYFGADFVLEDILAGESNWALGAVRRTPWENTYKLGVNIARIFKAYMLFGINSEGFDHYGFAFGANMGRFSHSSYFHSVEGMMQFVSIANQYGEANANHITFYARTEFGKHREEVFAGK